MPELNLGQLALLLQARFTRPLISYTKVQGKPFFRHEIHSRIREILTGVAGSSAATVGGAA